MTRQQGNKVSKPDIILIGEILRRTDKAIQFQFIDPETEEEHTEWFPLSQVTEIHNTSPATIHVSDWIWNQKVESWEA